MRESLRRCRLAANFLGLVLAGGCHHAQPCCPSGETAAPHAALPADTPGPIFHTVNKPSSPNPTEGPRNPQSPVIASAVPTPDERPATPRFAHDVDYKWLMGTISYSRAQNAWLLRYVPFEEDDRYGGIVTLTDCGSMDGAKNGQAVRVEGHLIDPGSRQLRPAFSVRALAPVGP